jgi:hypothetical protein
MLKRAQRLGAAAVASILSFGVALLHAGGCQSTCATSADCGASSYCSTATGICLSAQAVGFCKDIPTSCPDVVAPVCGCDGKQYPNTCEAAKARVSISSSSACSTNCGGPATLKCTDATTYCHFMDGVCGQGNATGTCDMVPTDCTDATPQAVCGCDNKTYASRCDAQKAGVSVLSVGACACGGNNNTPCEAGKYCQFATGTCTQPNPSGTCVEIPTGSCSPFLQPVCACDGKTYTNACEAAKAMQSVAQTGACPCGGPAGVACQPSEYCTYVLVGDCLSPGRSGTCAPRPTSCTPVNSPVCGCDGKQYPNPCEAAKAGSDVGISNGCTPGDAGTG